MQTHVLTHAHKHTSSPHYNDLLPPRHKLWPVNECLSGIKHVNTWTAFFTYPAVCVYLCVCVCVCACTIGYLSSQRAYAEYREAASLQERGCVTPRLVWGSSRSGFPADCIKDFG